MNYFRIILVLGVLLGAMSCKTQKPAGQAVSPGEPAEVSQIRQLESTAELIEATKQRLLGNYANAIQLYAEAVKADPRNSAALYELARLHARQGLMRDAEVFARQAVNLEPDNKYYNLILADIYFVQNKNEQGLRVQQQLARTNPYDVTIQISLLSTLLYLEKYPEAIAQLESIERMSGFNHELSLQKQRIYLEMGQTDKAIEEVMKLISFFPDEPVYLEVLAELYQEIGQPEKAYEIYYRMLEIQPDNAMAYLLLADYYRNNGEEEKSFEKLRQAFLSDRLGVDGKVRILASYYFLSEEDSLYASQALVLCNILLEAHPDAAEAHAMQGEFLLRDNKLEEARQSFSRAAALDPSELGHWQQLLFTKARLEDYQGMLNTSEEALEYFFEQAVLYYFNGIANRQLKNYNKAIASFKAGLDLSFSQPDLQGQFYSLLGDTYHLMEEYEKSFQNYEKALDINPDDPYALNNYSYYMSLRGVELDKALIMSARSLELEPDNAAFQDTYGWINYKLGNYQKAQIWIRKSLDNSETPSTVVLEHYGDVLYKLGRKDDALRYWKKALEARGDSPDDKGSEFLEKKVEQGTLYE